MIRWLLLILVLATAMLLGPSLVNNPGYIKIILAGRVFEFTALGLVVILVLSAVALWLVSVLLRKLLRLQHVSFNFLRWRRQRKAQQAFELGLQAYAKQQWQLASAHLAKAAADDFMHNEKHLLAAYAAFYAGNTDQANRHVAALPAADNSSCFVQADLLLQQGQAAQACVLLAEQVNADTEDKGLGQLYLYALQQAGQWQQLLQMVPAALKQQWFDKDKWRRQRFNIYPAAVSQLSQQQRFDEAAAYWQNLPAKERKSTAANIGLAWAQAQNGQSEAAEKLLLSNLQLEELPLTLAFLRQIPLGKSVLKLRKQAQSWLRDHNSNGYVYALLAYLAEQEGEPEQAELALQKARQYEPKLG
ncbi:heme biosynthesis HemY N-terminal domain-containing protein [Rheinheimera sp.]|uniref:heme biosynthesis HemY N-terminal domain-containing protein n=1 Tax=Rheinheimera sp. TaxID=1869214 RepID=UPI0027357151|nr:heme biosynthesis HemY N-terminal domain-containing protein [Rheinheimera sp.]MDP2714123.1 heme biosynthesis HemY N-terminal domain-containing protein [Rheinheimera sp.]